LTEVKSRLFSKTKTSHQLSFLAATLRHLGFEMSSYRITELEVLRWAEARKIIPRSTAMAQSIKTLEEVTELISALHRNDKEEALDAYGDILVTLIIGADLAGVDMVQALNHAYSQIKDRKGTLREDGVFVKEQP
jgi:NTP pyrophosphatase (non-canonical NTP hydrolase)